MPWARSAADPLADPAAADVMAAFDSAEQAGLPTAECYLAAVEVWRRVHPDQAIEYASKQAVEVILKARVSVAG